MEPVSLSLFHLSMLGDWPDLDPHFGTKKGLRDCQQITLILRNRILSDNQKSPAEPPVSNRQN